MAELDLIEELAHAFWDELHSGWETWAGASEEVRQKYYIEPLRRAVQQIGLMALIWDRSIEEDRRPVADFIDKVSRDRGPA